MAELEWPRLNTPGKNPKLLYKNYSRSKIKIDINDSELTWEDDN